MKTKKAISLIVLVITIIVMIILAGAIIVTLMNNGIIDRAQDAVEQANLKSLQELATVGWSQAYMQETNVVKNDAYYKTEVVNYLKANGYTEAELSKYVVQANQQGVTVSLRNMEKNAYGFYFDAPYVGTTEDGKEIAIIMTENGGAAMYLNGLLDAYASADSVSYEEGEITYSSTILSVTGSGTELTLPAGVINNEDEIVCTLADYPSVEPYYNKPYEVQITSGENTITYGCTFGEGGVVAWYEAGQVKEVKAVQQSTFPYVLTYNKEQIVIPQGEFSVAEDTVLTATTKQGTGTKFGSTYYLDSDDTAAYVFDADGTATYLGTDSESTYTYAPYYIYEDGEVLGALSYTGKYLVKLDGTKYTAKVLTEVDLMTEQTLTFVDDTYRSTGLKCYRYEPSTELVTGETYVIVWDGTEYTVPYREFKGTTTTALGTAGLTLPGWGDGTIITSYWGMTPSFTTASTGEPFFIGLYGGSSSDGFIIWAKNTASTHTVRIYQTVLE